jgi:F0F1-type ATP synthase assembly protein I
MSVSRPAGDDLLDVARVLLLLQCSILVATTIEALVWGLAFPGAGGVSALLTAVPAATLLVARARLRRGRTWARRAVYGVEGVILAFFAVDTALAVIVTRGLPPIVAILTRLVLPVCVIALLRRSRRAARAPLAPAVSAAGLEAFSWT